MKETHKENLKKANEAVSKGKYEAFLNFCTDDVRWMFVGDRVLNGKEAVRQWMLDQYSEPPQIEVNSLIAERDELVAMGHITVRDKNGGNRQYAYCDVWRFRNGKMAELIAFVVESNDLKKAGRES